MQHRSKNKYDGLNITDVLSAFPLHNWTRSCAHACPAKPRLTRFYRLISRTQAQASLPGAHNHSKSTVLHEENLKIVFVILL